MRRPARLTSDFVKAVKKPGRYSDGPGSSGLSLLVRPIASGLSKTWQQRFKIEGRQRSIGLGSMDGLSLRSARQLAAENAARLRAARQPSGIDRLLAEQGVIVDAPAPAPTSPALQDVFAEFVEFKAGSWKAGAKTERDERSRFDRLVRPALGNKPIGEVTRGELVDVLSPLWHEKQESALKLKLLLSGLYDFAVSKDYVTGNPMPTVVTGLGRQKRLTKHHDAIPHAGIPFFLSYVRESRTYPAKKLALELLLLTATRTSEVLKARWQEFDLRGAKWAIPADRTKTSREHRVPLSAAAVDVLRRAQTALGLAGPGDLVFPDNRDRRKPITPDGLRHLMRYRYQEATPHGLRSSFRDWAAEETDFDAQLAEHALGHVEGSASVRAYLRTDFFVRRGELMEAWAAHVLKGVGQ